MISQNNNISLDRTNQKQTGVSLMLAILILAAVMAIAFSLATIVIIEVRSAGDASRTEPTLYAAFGVTEEKLFQYKRFFSGTNNDDSSCAGKSACEINNVGLSLPGTQPIAFDDSPRVEFIPAGTRLTLPMFQSEPLTYDAIYDYVTVEVLPNGPPTSTINFYFKVTAANGDCRVERATGTCDDAEIVGEPAGVNNPQTFDSFGSGQYELILDNSDSVDDVSVVITTRRVAGATPAGLPYIGEQVLRIRADYRGLNRTYQVRIPIP